MLKPETLNRVFKYNGAILADIGPEMSPDDIRLHHANFYPELLNATVEGPVFSKDTITYTFKGSVGTKG